MSDRVTFSPSAAEEVQSPLAAQYAAMLVADKPSVAPATGGSHKESEDQFFKSALAVPADQVAKGFQDAQAASRTFLTESAGGDKEGALDKQTPAFQAAIKQSDSDYVDAIVKYSPDYLDKKHALEGTQRDVVESLAGLKGAVAAAPEENRERIASLIQLGLQKGNDKDLQEQILQSMDKYPGLRKAFEQTQTALNSEEKAETAWTDAAKPLMHAAAEEAATRFMYAEAMQMAGHGGEAVLKRQEGQQKLDDAAFEYLEVPKPPKQELKA